MPIMSKSCGDLQAFAGRRGQYDDHLRGFRGNGIASHWNWWSLTTENPKTPPLARRNGRSIVPNRSEPEATVASVSNSRKNLRRPRVRAVPSHWGQWLYTRCQR
jgi:hypothetical protein